jgi:hypothetical protein
MANGTAKPRGTTPPPRCKAILLCEKAIIEAGTQQVSLIGITDTLMVPGLPGVLQPFSVYLQLTDGIGHYQASVEFRDLAEDIVMARAAVGTVKWDDRLETINLIMPVRPIEVQRTGAYDLVVLADGQEIERRRFTVSVRNDTQEGEGTPEQ